MADTRCISFNKALNRKVPEAVLLEFRDCFKLDGSKPNQAVAAMLKISGRRSFDWRGPMVAYGYAENKSVYRVGRDLNPNDSRLVKDFLHTYDPNDHGTYVYNNEHGQRVIDKAEGGKERTRNATTIPKSLKSLEEVNSMIQINRPVMGVRINCLGDQKKFGVPALVQIKLHSTHSIFHDRHDRHDDTSDIASLIELPILTMKEPPHPAWEKAENLTLFDGHSPFENPAATSLHIWSRENATQGSSWGMLPPKWCKNVGSVLVVRQDKKPLERLHIEALCQWCELKIAPMLPSLKDLPRPVAVMMEKKMQQIISRAEFESY
ncbi:hypothetical protein SLS56_001323 [Neofusicoccum ribis]|uniref:Uncharacterized protein n=1 Tax=Neofusicoccum ribis TaxID=45134 RepID=A0ABR3T9P1_9PEZI